MGWIQIVCCLSIHCSVIFGLGLTGEGDRKLEIVCSLLFLITGLVSLINAYYINQSLVITTIVMSILSAVAARVLFSFSQISALEGTNQTDIISYSCIAITGLVMEVISIMIWTTYSIRCSFSLSV